MRLAELRAFSIRRQSRIRFTLRNGMECVVTERGIAQVPALKGIPDFNLEEELGAASEFVVERVGGTDQAAPPKPRRMGPRELAEMAAESSPAGAAAPREDE